MDGIKTIFDAIIDDKINALTSFVKDINTFDEEYGYPLHFAMRNDNNNDEMIEALIRLGADVNLRDNFERNALHYAAMTGCSSDTIELLDNCDALDNVKDRYGFYPIQYAAKNDDIETFKSLVQCNPGSVYYINDDKINSLFIAARYSSMNVLKYLIEEFGMNIYEREVLGGTLIIEAVDGIEAPPLGMHLYLGCIDYLVSKGVDINAIDGEKHTALYYAVDKPVEVINKLFECGACANVYDNDGKCIESETALHLSCEGKDNIKITELLLEHDADVNALNNRFETPLITAIRYHSTINALLILLSRDDIFINHQDNMGRTALHWAIIENDLLATKALLRYKSNNDGEVRVDILDDMNNSPLDYINDDSMESMLMSIL